MPIINFTFHFKYMIYNLFHKKNIALIFILFASNLVFSQCPVTAPTGIDSCRINGGTVQLGATGASGYYNWYDAAVGGNLLGFGDTYITPHIFATTNYYVAAADTNITLDFDGANDHITLGNPAQLQITGDMTIEMWLKPDNFSSRKNPYAKAYGGEGTITQEPDGRLNFYYGTHGGNSTPYQGFNSGASIIENEWNHIAIVRDLGNMQLRWYINGVLTNQTAANYGAATAGGNDVTIGSGYVNNYDGQIDELRVWNDVRTQTEIQDNRSLCLTGGEAGLVAYYNFNTGTGTTTATDLTAFGNNGVLTNMDAVNDWVFANYDYSCVACESPRTAVTATITPGTSVNLGNNSTFNCGATSLNLDAGVGYANYLWSTGAITQTITVSSAGIYWVQVDDGGGCSDSDTTLIFNSGSSGTCLDFDGIDDYVMLGNEPEFQITGNMTVEMWLNPDNFSSRKNPYAKAYGGEGTITQEPNGTLNYYYGTNGDNNHPYQGFNSGSPITSNQWNHIAIVRDLTSMQLRWYINGVLTNQGAASYAAATAGTNDVTIGSGYVDNYDGEIDELRIWNTARTQTNIRDKMCSKLSVNEPGIVAYYNFDNGAGTTLNNLTYSTSNGTVNNGPSWSTSGAPIGDNSAHVYTANWLAQTLNLAYCGGENFTVSDMTGTPDGVHIYSVGVVPNSTTGITGLGSNDRYFGVFKVNDAAATYTATYDYTGNTHVGPAQEPTVMLFRRADNADPTWVNTAATLNVGPNTLIATAESTEFILGSSNVPLPISLTSFNATLNKDIVVLNWATSTEINNDFFIVQKSKNGFDWKDVLTVSGAGNSSHTINYTQIDKKPHIGVSYYRLKQTDFDSQFSYSDIVSINYQLEDIKGTMSIFPNPIIKGNELNVDFKNIDNNDLYVVLRNKEGKEFYSKLVKNNEDEKRIGIPIDANIPSGIYLITASSEKHLFNKKLIIK
ncbi:MAG: LamG-like jellyroll fold domain-containing protein [Vicingaceae bacterium]